VPSLLPLASLRQSGVVSPADNQKVSPLHGLRRIPVSRETMGGWRKAGEEM